MSDKSMMDELKTLGYEHCCCDQAIDSIIKLQSTVRSVISLLNAIGDDRNYDCLKSDVRVNIYDTLAQIKSDHADIYHSQMGEI